MRRILPFLILLLATPALVADNVGHMGADPVAVARIHADIVVCPGCRLMGAN